MRTGPAQGRAGFLETMELEPKSYFLVTMHRAENVDDESRLRNLILGLERLAAKWSFPVVCSFHPRTRAKVGAFSVDVTGAGLRFVEPFGFFDFLRLEQEAFCILSDSGTVQEEACILGVPNVTIRDVTERPETIECGSNILAGADQEEILRAVCVVTDRAAGVEPAPGISGPGRLPDGLQDRPGLPDSRTGVQGSRFREGARDAGHEVQVLTGFPNYPEGRLYPGYRIQPFLREACDGIPVCRAALYPSHDRSAIRRVLNYLSFALSASTFGLLNVDDVDVVYVYVPPATAIVPAILLRVLARDAIRPGCAGSLARYGCSDGNAGERDGLEAAGGGMQTRLLPRGRHLGSLTRVSADAHGTGHQGGYDEGHLQLGL